MNTQTTDKTLSQWQEEITNVIETYKLNSSIEYRLLDVMSELGEVSKEMLKMTEYGKTDPAHNQNFAEEVGDLLFSLFTVANAMQVDLNKALRLVIDKYHQRFAETGDIGSGE